MPTVAFFTLGCKVNQFETDSLAELFRSRGYNVVPFEQQADVYVINTCTVTNSGDRKSRQMIRRAARPGSVVVVTGCYAQTEPGEVLNIPGVDLVVGTQGRERIVDLVEEQRRGMAPRSIVGELSSRFEDIPAYEFAGRTRAMVKIQEGCRQFCSYCKVPFARGPLRSMPADDVLGRVRALIDRGYKEIVLTGIHLGLYERETGGAGLANLVRRVLDLPGLVRLRLGSLEPMDFDDHLIALFESQSPLCPHLHLPLQSGSDEVLQRMRRPYAAEEFLRLVERLRGANPDLAVSTDIIVGFPGETDARFAESYRFCERVGFSRMHVFQYSPRRGTPAAEWPDQVPAVVKRDRGRSMRALGRNMAVAYHRRFIGCEVRVLTEEQQGDTWFGLTPHYVRAGFRRASTGPNETHRVMVKSADAQGVRGEAAD